MRAHFSPPQEDKEEDRMPFDGSVALITAAHNPAIGRYN